MITRFLTSVKATFNPFSRTSKTARLFLAYFPSDARSTINIEAKMLPRTSKDPSSVVVTFKDGKVLTLNSEALDLTGVVEEMDRHSRSLARKADLEGN